MKNIKNIYGGAFVISTPIKSKLKNLAKDEQSTAQNKLITYALERTIYKMFISDYIEYFTLKGGNLSLCPI